MKNFKNGLSFGFLCMMLIWGVMGIEFLFPIIKQFGIVPREVSIRSFAGIFLSPLIHGDINHIMANSISLFILAVTLMASYERLAIRVVLLIVLIGGCLVWLFAREATVHIGASGLIFGLVGFLIFNVFFRKDWRSLFVAIPIGFLYWTVIFGIFPSDPNISWEGHLFGLLTGVWLSYILRKSPAN
jgi:membrane associated rhomboid family serine protease